MKKISLFAAAILLAGCASLPSGPSIMALPGTGRNFDEFRIDDQSCRDYAFQQIGGHAREKEANNQIASSAALGAAVGALAGAAIGGRDGAGFGAGAGILVGSANGAERTQGLRGGQRQYDNAYVQCMYAKGHRVPVNGVYQAASATASGTSPAASIPPPPAGMPPPPPPTTR